MSDERDDFDRNEIEGNEPLEENNFYSSEFDASRSESSMDESHSTTEPIYPLESIPEGTGTDRAWYVVH